MSPQKLNKNKIKIKKIKIETLDHIKYNKEFDKLITRPKHLDISNLK